MGELTLYMELYSFLNTVEDTCTFFKPLAILLNESKRKIQLKVRGQQQQISQRKLDEQEKNEYRQRKRRMRETE